MMSSIVSREPYLHDELEPCFIKSFSIHPHSPYDASFPEIIKNFFQEYGFIVFRDVFTPDECDRTIDAMISICKLESPVFDMSTPSTWNHLKSIGKYGLNSRGPCFHPVLVNNRQNPRLASILSLVLETTIDDMIVSHDRFAIYRPTISSSGDYDSTLSTGPRNLHLDLNPWWWLESSDDIIKGLNTLAYEDPQDFIKENNLVVKSMGSFIESIKQNNYLLPMIRRHVQCVLNFMDNYEEDGGTILIPKFPSQLQDWCEKHQHLRQPVPWMTLPTDQNDMKSTTTTATTSRNNKKQLSSSKSQSLSLCEEDSKPNPYEIHQQLLEQAIRIPMRKGSVLIWDQTMIHGTCPNQSSHFRMVQYLKACIRSKTYRWDDNINSQLNQRIQRRSRLLNHILTASISSGELQITEIGHKLFGLDVIINHDDDDDE